MKKYKSHALLFLTIISIPFIIFFSDIRNHTGRDDLLFEKAKVVRIVNEQLTEDTIIPGLFLGSQELEVEILSGKYSGNHFSVRNAMSRLYNIHTKENMTVIVQILLENEQPSQVFIHNYFREPLIYVLIFLFFFVLIIFGGMKGFTSAISLVFTGVLILFFMIPMIFKGANPLIITTITVSITTMVTLVLIGGFNKKSLSAILGTIAGVITAGIISYISGNIAHLSGLTMEEAESLIYLAESSHLKLRGLMFSAILIASLGAIMDVGMSISSSIFEIYDTNPNILKKDLFKSGMNIGRDVMGTMSNTLILAFTGGSLNIMLLIMAYAMPYHQLINLDLICTELIQGIAGTIGIVLTVPITSFISVSLIKKSSIGRFKGRL